MELLMDEEELLLLDKINDTMTSHFSELYSSTFKVFLSVTYTVILVFGVLLNISPCVVIRRNRALHTTTNFYLLNLSISTLLLFICELPFEVYRLWNSFSYPLEKVLCITVGFLSETCANASVLTITAFTFERYISICRPLKRHKRKSTGVLGNITAIWLIALVIAAVQVSLSLKFNNEKEGVVNTVKESVSQHFFVLPGLVLSVGAMIVIIKWHGLIYFKLKKLPSMHPVNERSNNTPRSQRDTSRKRVKWMLAVVTLSVFLSWASLHGPRLIAIYGKNLEQPDDTSHELCISLRPLSGMIYFLFTAINPFLCTIMSTEFRNAFKVTLKSICRRRDRSQLDRTQSDLLAFRNELAEERAEQRPRHSPLQLPTISSQLCDALPRAQSLDVVTAESESWHWRQHFAKGLNSLTSPQSISNSGLREIDQEESKEEQVIYLHQVNCKIVEENRDTSVEDVRL